jgi:ATP-dependent Clp protease ATP-binding subunit ClpX
MGFSAEVCQTEIGSLAEVTPDDLMRYGMIPEFVGRFPSWVSLTELSVDNMVDILTKVRHNFVEQYQWLFSQDGIKLTFQDAAIKIIAQRALDSGTGARGLHSELERVLLPHMFELCSYAEQNIDMVIIDEALVNNPSALKG